MAESVASAAVEDATKQAMKFVSTYLRYFFCYGKIVQDFKNQQKELKWRKQRVDTRVDEAKRQIEVIYEDVEDWLKRAEKELDEAQYLQDEIDRVKCFKWCPQWGWRYCLSKKLAEKTPIIYELLEKTPPNFAPVGRRGSLKGIEFITSTNFRDFESSKSALNKITEAINAKGVDMIGLYGMPGVGKTTLAKEVGKHAQKLFDKVVIFTMTQTPDIRKIQDKVAERFGLKFEKNTEEGRAEELFTSMQRVNKILVIVDDLWEEFKLERIGIPFGDYHKGCKILLTTRQQQVCCEMRCQEEIQLGILSKDEAWVLFRDQAGLEDDCSILNEVAREVADECKGLPLAIVTVAKALKDKTLDEWRDANQRFKDSTHLYDEEILGGVIEPLKLSYDYLKKGNNQMTGNDIQMCFLLCSLFPEDYEIAIEEVIIIGIGVGLFPYANSIEDKRKKIVGAVKKLQKSGLLLETDDAGLIIMHDVVRDFAHRLTLTGENRFMVKEDVKEWPHMDESSGCYTAIALFRCSTNINFPDKVKLPKLKTLFLGGEWKRDDFLLVSSKFFEEMKALQVLTLANVSFSPKGFHSLPNLKTLYCLNCKLENFASSLTNMRSLEILALINTKIDEISEELVKLSTLKLLYVNVEEDEEEEMNFPPNLLSRLTSLRELYVGCKNNINLLELNSSHLTALSLSLSTNQFPQEDFEFPKLQRYVIVVGDNISYQEAITSRKLTIQNFSSSLSAFNNLFCNVEKLKLRNVSGLKNIMPTIGEKVKLNIQSMVSLKGLCYGLSPTRFLQNLKQVSIEDCEKLQVIFEMDKLSEKVKCQTPLFSKLTILKLDSLPKLESIWKLEPTHHAIASLSHSTNFCIEGCEKIERFILVKDQVSSSSNGDTGLQPISLPNLTEITITNCENLKSLFPFGSVPAFPKLESLIVKRNSKLEQVFELEDEVEVAATTEKEMKFDKLKRLSLEELPGLIHFSPKGYHFVLSALRDLKVRDCPTLTTGFFIDSQEFVHCKTKAPQLVGNDAIQESATVPNAILNENIYWSQELGEGQLPHII